MGTNRNGRGGRRRWFFPGLCAGLALCALALSCVGQAPVREGQRLCRPCRYPILLVHGFFLRDDNVPYWGDIPSALRQAGYRVYQSNQDAVASIEENAQALSDALDRVLADSGAEKVNIIAHSKGGLESRYLISSLRRGDKIACLVTISTPHRGSAMASYLLDNQLIANPSSVGAINTLAKYYLGDHTPDVAKAAAQLRPEYMAEFNRQNPDDERVCYWSYTSLLDEGYGMPAYVMLWHILYDLEGPNDGFVSLSSARWGQFRGVVGQDRGLAISHSEIHNLPIVLASGRFDAPAFYVDLAEDLARNGY